MIQRARQLYHTFSHRFYTTVRNAVVLAGSAVLVASPALAQTADASAGTPPAAPADVASIDAITAAVYAVISGDSAVKRDWNRFRSLFAPGARFMPIVQRGNGPRSAVVWTAEQYITNAGPGLERNGFHEREVSRKVEQYGAIAHVFSTYESRAKATDVKPFARGINSIQLWYDGTRWWVQSIMWWQETPTTPIPPHYLVPPTGH
jgi:hypothetical protein